MLRFKPRGIALPLLTFNPIAGLKVGTEARFPDGGQGIVTSVGSKTTVQYLGTPLDLSRNTSVSFTNRELAFYFHQQGIIGRTLNALGEPIDGQPEVVGEALPIYGGILNPTRRTLAEGLIQTGFPALDAKEPIPQGIKILWMKRPEESLDYAIARTLMRARYRRRREDPLRPLTVVFCALGLTRDSLLFFQGIRRHIPRSVFVLHSASEPAISALTAPHTACQIGEQLAMAGEEVLLVIHDMRIFYNALAEVRGVQGAPPGKDNSPVDFYSQAARIYERAFIRERGSLTEIVVMSSPNLDHSEIGVNLTKYSTEGHIPWSQGKLDFLAALSRLKGAAFHASREDHKALQRAITASYSRALEVREQASLGLNITGATDLAYLRFATLFEHSVLNTDEFLDVDQSLDRCWYALGEVPAENLDIDRAIKANFHHYRAPQADGVG
jgi:V/A-type H+-transporting ATPase subunit B